MRYPRHSSRWPLGDAHRPPAARCRSVRAMISAPAIRAPWADEVFKLIDWLGIDHHGRTDLAESLCAPSVRITTELSVADLQHCFLGDRAQRTSRVAVS